MSVKTTFLKNDGKKWYHLEGTDYGTGYDLNSDYAIDGDTVLDIDGYPLTDGDVETIAVKNSIAIYNAASSLGKIGGSKTSDAKKKSSAENGKKGGRPKRYTNTLDSNNHLC